MAVTLQGEKEALGDFKAIRTSIFRNMYTLVFVEAFRQ